MTDAQITSAFQSADLGDPGPLLKLVGEAAEKHAHRLIFGMPIHKDWTKVARRAGWVALRGSTRVLHVLLDAGIPPWVETPYNGTLFFDVLVSTGFPNEDDKVELVRRMLAAGANRSGVKPGTNESIFRSVKSYHVAIACMQGGVPESEFLHLNRSLDGLPKDDPQAGAKTQPAIG